MRPGKIISGGQTGVDRAALDFAIERGIPWGGWAPAGWRSEDGAIPERYRGHMCGCHLRAAYRRRDGLDVAAADRHLAVAQRDDAHARDPGPRRRWAVSADPIAAQGPRSTVAL